MKRIVSLILIFTLLSLSLFGCSAQTGGEANTGEEEGEGGDSMPFIFRGTVFEVAELLGVEMEETEFSSGPYHVITGEDTTYFDADGNQTAKDAIKVGDVIEITFSGQVMMSYPPKISAKSIKIVSESGNDK